MFNFIQIHILQTIYWVEKLGNERQTNVDFDFAEKLCSKKIWIFSWILHIYLMIFFQGGGGVHAYIVFPFSEKAWNFSGLVSINYNMQGGYE